MGEKKLECKVLKRVRDKKKLTQQELQLVTTIAKEELKFLARNNIPLIPENYLLWFKVFCYLVENDLKLSDFEIIGLFKEKYPTIETVEIVLVEVNPQQRELLKKVAQEIVEEVDKVIESLDLHNKNLEEKELSFKEIKEGVSDTTVKGLLERIQGELSQVKSQNEELKRNLKLEEANDQIRKLTKELEESRREASIDFLTQVANKGQGYNNQVRI